MTKEIAEEEFKISIEELFPKFNEHLEIKNNNRILFSGKFGIGKTYFLNEFFENKKEDYDIFIQSGLVHIIAVSGGNILMIVVFL